MIIIEDLLSEEPALHRFAAQPEMDPLTETDALQEAQLLGIRFDAVRSTVGLLFELRLALQLRAANTGVLVAHGVRQLAWTASARMTVRTAWNVVASTPRCADRLFQLSLWTSPDGELGLTAESAVFYVGDVAGLDEIPDYIDDDDATIRDRIAGWHSTFTPVHAVFLDPAPLTS
jgi:hypothetical protein